MMRLATITKQRIADAIENDQGAYYRKCLQKILPKIEDAYRGQDTIPFRTHLGASLIGRDCAFELWLSFRWTQVSLFPERILRLFNRGHLEEAHFLAMLEAAGIPCWYETEDGGQFRYSNHGGHFGSALDGIVKIPELEGKPAYAEFKTHNDKSFKSLVKSGVQNSKYEHYVQMQLCMQAYDLKYAVYFAVNKNDDDLYIEIIEYDEAVAKQYLDRAKMIIFSTEAPPRISNKKTFFKCKFCDKSDLCHEMKKPEINCRTCAHSTPLESGGWVCEYHGYKMAKEAQFKGCEKHIFNPHLMTSVEMVGASESSNYLELKLDNGDIIKHGPNHITSKELKLWD